MNYWPDGGFGMPAGPGFAFVLAHCFGSTPKPYTNTHLMTLVLALLIALIAYFLYVAVVDLNQSI